MSAKIGNKKMSFKNVQGVHDCGFDSLSVAKTTTSLVVNENIPQQFIASTCNSSGTS